MTLLTMISVLFVIVCGVMGLVFTALALLSTLQHDTRTKRERMLDSEKW